MKQVIKCRYNVLDINSLKSFAAIRGRRSSDGWDVYFLRMLGWNREFGKEVLEMDAELAQQMKSGKLFYCRVSALPKQLSREDTEIYSECYNRWKESQFECMQTKTGSVSRTNEKLAAQLGAACSKLAKLYSGRKKAVSESIVKNFIVKLLYWFDFVFDGMGQWEEQSCVKIAADNIVKEQEYLFYYFLTLTGCDVLLLQSREDVQGEENRKLSKAVRIGEFMEHEPEQRSAEEEPEKIVMKVPRHGWQQNLQSRHQVQNLPCPQYSQQEKSFEELASLASSIVMIEVRSKEGGVISTGSGIMAGRDGYILTNEHVVRYGCHYSVRIENDAEEYWTDELIKYNSVLDLALLRIHRRLDPLPVYKGMKQLVRGQTVVAIGSPLGLFNSVSNGIISGFRRIDGVDMIQFTAPISSGSSGGAVLNMYGEVIGISTAGFDRGQNINLAVGYENIRLFIKGF